LYHADDLPFSLRDIPDVFTKFRKKVEQECQVRGALNAPSKINSPTIEPLFLPDLAFFGYTKPLHDPRIAFNFVGGECAANNRVHEYLFKSHAIATYKETRNGLIGANYSSKLSPYLALGCISPKAIYHQVIYYEKQNGASNNTYWLIFELLWRDYFRFVMKKHGKKLFLKGGIKGIAPILPDHDTEKLDSWINGKTGQPFIDANMKELAATGFMSNRGRQNVASYLCHHLKIDWRYGASYFEQQLIDYDASSNWGNWAYLAGVGNDPREERIFNPEKQAADYDPKQKYQTLWLEKSTPNVL
jgi:deoxyribodipyrimidine photo-lyase